MEVQKWMIILTSFVHVVYPEKYQKELVGGGLTHSSSAVVFIHPEFASPRSY